MELCFFFKKNWTTWEKTQNGQLPSDKPYQTKKKQCFTSSKPHMLPDIISTVSVQPDSTLSWIKDNSITNKKG